MSDHQSHRQYTCESVPQTGVYNLYPYMHTHVIMCVDPRRARHVRRAP